MENTAVCAYFRVHCGPGNAGCLLVGGGGGLFEEARSCDTLDKSEMNKLSVQPLKTPKLTFRSDFFLSLGASFSCRQSCHISRK